MNPERTVDVPAYINAHRFSGYQWLIMLLCFLVIMIDGLDAAAIGYIAPALVQDWGISNAALGPVLSAALFGGIGGAIFVGPLADHFGRKTVLVGAVVFFGVMTLVTTLAANITAMTALRFLAGLGLSAAMPSATTLIAEFVPESRRAIVVNVVFGSFPLGAAAGGIMASWLISHFGWRSVFVAGGLAPLVLTVALVACLPESVKYLVTKRQPVARIRKILSRIGGETLADATAFTVNEAAPNVARSTVGVILSRHYAFGTAMLCLTYCMGLVIFYVFTSWMPTLLRSANFTVGHAALIAALFQLGGGVGTILSGWLMDKFNPQKIVAMGYALTAALIYMVGRSIGTIEALVVLMFLAGVAMNGAQSSMPSLAAAFYPTYGRATGMAWMLGSGRFGGIVGTLLGAELMRLQMGFGATLAWLAMPPAIIATLALLFKNAWEHRRASSEGFSRVGK